MLFSYGNYAGDVLNFGAAQDRLRAEGIDCRTVLVTDDVACAPPDEGEKRRGVAGDLMVFKIAGAAADEGDALDGSRRLARKANAATGRFGVAFDGCTLPGKTEPLFTRASRAHGARAGHPRRTRNRTVRWIPARELAAVLLEPAARRAAAGAGRRPGRRSILNGLGATSTRSCSSSGRPSAGCSSSRHRARRCPEVGEFVTSLDMAGCSLTLTWLDDELEELWTAPADTPAFRRGSVAERQRFEAVIRAAAGR